MLMHLTYIYLVSESPVLQVSYAWVLKPYLALYFNLLEFDTKSTLSLGKNHTPKTLLVTLLNGCG